MTRLIVVMAACVLACEGPMGPPGPQGEQGEQGEPGPPLSGAVRSLVWTGVLDSQGRGSVHVPIEAAPIILYGCHLRRDTPHPWTSAGTGDYADVSCDTARHVDGRTIIGMLAGRDRAGHHYRIVVVY